MPSFSISSFVNYGNDQVNNKETALSAAFRKDVKDAIKLAGYPTKDEIDIIDTMDNIKMTNTLEQIPALVGNYIKDTDHDFEIPRTDEETCAVSIARRHVDETIKSGVSVMGGVEKSWTSVVAAHNEYYVKNKRKPFKK